MKKQLSYVPVDTLLNVFFFMCPTSLRGVIPLVLFWNLCGHSSKKCQKIKNEKQYLMQNKEKERKKHYKKMRNNRREQHQAPKNLNFFYLQAVFVFSAWHVDPSFFLKQLRGHVWRHFYSVRRKNALFICWSLLEKVKAVEK